MATGIQIVLDCTDPASLAVFWASALGYVVQPPPEGFPSWEGFLAAAGVPEEEWNSASAIIDPEGQGPRLFFQRVPEPKSVKNRLHLDVNVGGPHGTPLPDRIARVDGEVARLVALGATAISPTHQRGEYWVVMQDPEGNEFCVQ